MGFGVFLTFRYSFFVLKLNTREKMKNISRFLILALALVSSRAYCDPVSTTLGSNLTAYNSGAGSMNNNNWNSMMNSRSSGGTAPAADFGNCNAVILRCASPKCAGGGCSSIDVATPIVSGCVNSNKSCAQYGNDLVQYIAAQLVADSVAASQGAAAAAQQAAAAAASQQSAQQMQAMQAQMQQMQSQMQQQSADSAAQLQAALNSQAQMTQQALADAQAQVSAQQQALSQQQAAAATNTAGVTDSQIAAAKDGISADILAREKISGQIMSQIENAEDALKTLKTTMNTAFEYAGCDSSGNNCTGPKRVAVFRQKAMQFFDPYNDVLDELYDALITAQAVGVDITDIYMMLNGTCNAWAKYMCAPGQVMHYTSSNCNAKGKSVAESKPSTWNTKEYGEFGTVRSGQKCTVGQVVPMSDGGCQLIKMLGDEEAQYNWLYPDEGNAPGVEVRVGCASEALDNSLLFRGRKKQASIDIEVLERIISQDAPSIYGSGLFGGTTTPELDGLKYCAVGNASFSELQQAASTKSLTKKVCITEKQLITSLQNQGTLVSGATGAALGGRDLSEYFEYYTVDDKDDFNCSVLSTQDVCKCFQQEGIWAIQSYGDEAKCLL